MKNIFIIPGYGIPKNILKDEPCKRYLGLVFNQIYQICLDKKEHKPIIIFCGGHTDIFKPYKRTESAEMKKLFLWFAKRDFVKNYTKSWQYKIENKSLSTVENLLFVKKITDTLNGEKYFYIFVEYTRIFKIKTFAKRIFVNKFSIIDLDFDLSINRYRDPEFIKKKEKIEIKFGLKSIKDYKFLLEYRKVLHERLSFFRNLGPQQHKEAINIWWQNKIKELENMGA
ncbi:MAG TPA: hypothetical protein PLK76_00720 [bacterium]|nr:hypothetical protein [bacterium]